MKIQENMTNIEMFKVLEDELIKTYEKVIDTDSSIGISRKVQEEDYKKFTKLKKEFNRVFQTDMKKMYGSPIVFGTSNEVVLTSKNEKEKLKVRTFKEILKDDDFEIPMFNKDTMDKLFPNHWRYQNQTGKKKFLSENMNAINELVTKTKVFDVNNNSFRYKWINTGYGIEHFLLNKFFRNDRYKMNRKFGKSARVCFWTRFNDDEDYRRNSMIGIYDVLWDFFDRNKPSMSWEGDDSELEERINSLPKDIVVEKIKQRLNELSELNENLDKHIDYLSIPTSEFFALLPDEVNKKIHRLMNKVEKEELRLSKLVRKNANIQTTINFNIELDVTETDDIEEVIRQKIDNGDLQILSNMKTFVDRDDYEGDYINVIDEDVSDVSISEVL